jgi:PKD repeat protein
VALFSSDDSAQCNLNCVDFFDSTSNNPVSWQWSFPGALTTTSAVQNPTGICYTTPGIYDVTLIVSNGFFSDTITQQVTISTIAATSIAISQNGNQLTCNPPISTYEWSLNSSVIPGATSQTITITQTGFL